MSPFFFVTTFDSDKFRLVTLAIPMSIFIQFMITYYILIPKVMMNGKTHLFVMHCAGLVLTLAGLLTVNAFWIFDMVPSYKTLLYFVRDVFNLSISSFLAVAIKLSTNWVKIEHEKKEAEIELKEAELKNLKNEVSPHFLLNTLNNIYALTITDTNKAQKAIQELGSLLRHILYDSRESYCKLSEEVEFIRNYVSLMKIRVRKDVEVTEDYDIHAGEDTMIAPMLLISLIENAFKHGISPLNASYIHIRLYADEYKIELDVVNTNHPKTYDDKSGHGIGLQQVRRRLDLCYPGQYEWTTNINNNNEYSIKLLIYDTKLRYYRR